jgi:hypothetical protein
MTIKSYVNEEIRMKGDPTSFKEALSRAHLSKWQEAMFDEMKLMNP